MNHTNFLIDACVMMDWFLCFRPNNSKANELMRLIQGHEGTMHIPAHAYFEYATTAITHYRKEPEKLADSLPSLAQFPTYRIVVIPLFDEYVGHLYEQLRGSPIPDLKSADMIYYCIAKAQQFALITEDKKLRSVAKAGGLMAYNIDEAVALFQQ